LKEFFILSKDSSRQQPNMINFWSSMDISWPLFQTLHDEEKGGIWFTSQVFNFEIFNYTFMHIYMPYLSSKLI